jgi:acyl-CoA thioesterase
MNSHAQDLANTVALAMFQNDRASRAFGMVLDEVRPGYARMSMTVRPDMLNAHEICHGGMIFTLADSCFAFACNSYNINTVASGCSIEFIHPVPGGERLTAEATEQLLSGRHGVYDIRVTNRIGEAVALFRGKSTQIRGNIVPVAE